MRMEAGRDRRPDMRVRSDDALLRIFEVLVSAVDHSVPGLEISM